MARIATKLRIGVAGCAVAAAAAVLPVAPAEAAPVTVPMHWFGGGSSGWFGGGSSHGGDLQRDIFVFFSFFHRPYDGPI
jgi:hypothetical protein